MTDYLYCIEIYINSPTTYFEGVFIFEYVEDILNQKNEWDGAVDAKQVAGSVPEITASSPSGVMTEHFVSSSWTNTALRHS